tara:strand:+ start:226 stop:471 length:246 start_codon:yes stop_codon:yes gene_type:complete
MILSRIASYFLVNIEEANSITGYSIKNPTKKIKAFFLKSGVYLCFIDETLLTKDIDEQFCELLYEDKLVILRYKDIVEFVI